MHVVEKFTRQGNQILYDVTVEDPEVLVEPWVMTTRTLRLNTNPDAGLLPRARQLRGLRAGGHHLPDSALARFTCVARGFSLAPAALKGRATADPVNPR